MSTLSSTLSASDARSNLYTILEEVSGKLKRFVITRRGKAQAVVMHPDEVAAWEETMEIMANSKLIKEINQGQADFAGGRVISEDKLLKDLGISEKDLE